MGSNQLIEILSDGGFHSGEYLGRCMGVSRTAVWKKINQLQRLGLQIHSVKGKGYRLIDSLELLSEPLIRAGLNRSASELFHAIDIQSEVVSTNDEVKGKVKTPALEFMPHVCFAERQSSGRGRRGKTWVSPYGANIYMSLCWTFAEAAGVLDGLSLCVGIAIADAIASTGVEGVGLKWPNDVLYQGRKLAGVLLELEGELSGPVQVVIGIGVNVAMSKNQGMEIDQDWISLADIAATTLSRNVLAAQILNRLAEVLPRFQAGGFKEFQARWHELDVMMNNPVVLSMANKQISGRARGVTATGELLIEGESGIKSYRGGELSLRMAK